MVSLPLQQKIPALFMFNAAIDISLFGIALIFAALIGILSKIIKVQKVTAYGAGTLAITLLCILFQEIIVAGNTDVLLYKTSQLATRYTLPVSKQSQTGGPCAGTCGGSASGCR